MLADDFYIRQPGRDVMVAHRAVEEFARVYVLNKTQARETVEFANSVKGTALDVENEHVGIVVFGSDIGGRKGRLTER